MTLAELNAALAKEMQDVRGKYAGLIGVIHQYKLVGAMQPDTAQQIADALAAQMVLEVERIDKSQLELVLAHGRAIVDKMPPELREFFKTQV